MLEKAARKYIITSSTIILCRKGICADGELEFDEVHSVPLRYLAEHCVVGVDPTM